MLLALTSAVWQKIRDTAKEEASLVSFVPLDPVKSKVIKNGLELSG